MDLKVYYKIGCADCMILERKLKENNIKFESINIDRIEPAEKVRIISESGKKKMPVVEKDGRFLSDEQIDKLFKKSVKIKVYSTPYCIYCAKAKEFLKENKMSFDDIDVSTNVEALKEMVKKSGQNGVPVIDVNGRIIVGFDEESLRDELNLN